MGNKWRLPLIRFSVLARRRDLQEHGAPLREKGPGIKRGALEKAPNLVGGWEDDFGMFLGGLDGVSRRQRAR